MEIFKYLNHKQYVSAQTNANVDKIKRVWVEDSELISVATYIKKYIPHAKFGLCHGARNGWEVKRLIQLLPDIKILGTDISHTAKKLPNMIQWDFHEIKPEWKKQ